MSILLYRLLKPKSTSPKFNFDVYALVSILTFVIKYINIFIVCILI